MEETYVRLRCPECGKNWESTPSDLPGVKRTFRCPDCHAGRRLSEFTRTGHDLETLKALQ